MESRVERSGRAPVLAIFDFDYSLIDDNSDTYVVAQANAEVYKRMRMRIGKVQWTKLMDSVLSELAVTHEPEELLRLLHSVSFPAESREIPRLIQSISVPGSSHSVILSDANDLFIREILDHHGLIDLFTDVRTNRALIVEEHGRRRISVDAYGWNHGCSRGMCAENMCKSKALDDCVAAIGSEVRCSVCLQLVITGVSNIDISHSFFRFRDRFRQVVECCSLICSCCLLTP